MAFRNTSVPACFLCNTYGHFPRFCTLYPGDSGQNFSCSFCGGFHSYPCRTRPSQGPLGPSTSQLAERQDLKQTCTCSGKPFTIVVNVCQSEIQNGGNSILHPHHSRSHSSHSGLENGSPQSQRFVQHHANSRPTGRSNPELWGSGAEQPPAYDMCLPARQGSNTERKKSK